jgi:hypothetical protein
MVNSLDKVTLEKSLRARSEGTRLVMMMLLRALNASTRTSNVVKGTERQVL